MNGNKNKILYFALVVFFITYPVISTLTNTNTSTNTTVTKAKAITTSIEVDWDKTYRGNN